MKSKIYVCGRGYSQVPAVPNSLKLHPKNTKIWGKKAIKIFNLTPKKLLRTWGDQGCSAKWQFLDVKKTTTACTQLYLIYVGITGCLGRWFKRALNNLLFGSCSVHKTLYRWNRWKVFVIDNVSKHAKVAWMTGSSHQGTALVNKKMSNTKIGFLWWIPLQYTACRWPWLSFENSFMCLFAG